MWLMTLEDFYNVSQTATIRPAWKFQADTSDLAKN